MKTAFATAAYARNTRSNDSVLLLAALAVKGNGTG